MRKKQIFLLGIFITLGFIAFAPILSVQATVYNCPNTKEGDTKILKVTTVNNESLNNIFGANWSDVLEGSFGKNSHKLGARLKSYVLGIENSTLNYSFFFFFTEFDVLVNAPICNISVAVWEWTVGEIDDSKNQTTNVYVLKDPGDLTNYTRFAGFGGNVTVPRSAFNISGVAGTFLGQLPTPPEDYLNDPDLVWEDNWTASGKKIIHDVHPGYTVAGNEYKENCTETWTYFDNGALIGYELVDKDGTTAYEYEFELPQIPGYEIPLFLGFTAISAIGIIAYLKRKKRI